MEYLKSNDVKWTSVLPACFAEGEEERVGPPYVWIGVRPGTLGLEDAKVIAEGCKEILAREGPGFPDVEIQLEESYGPERY